MARSVKSLLESYYRVKTGCYCSLLPTMLFHEPVRCLQAVGGYERARHDGGRGHDATTICRISTLEIGEC